MSTKLNTIITLVAGICVAGLTACGPQGYVVTASLQKVVAPGSFIVPPKVDIVLVEDDTGSIAPIYTQLNSQMPTLLTSLAAENWDYHFTMIPLTTAYTTPLSEATASFFDANWVGSGQWQAPYPGAVADPASSIQPSIFVTPTKFNFIPQLGNGDGTDGLEPGLATIRKAFAERIPNTGFLRSDALTVILVVGNGEDTSAINICTRAGDNFQAPCDSLGAPVCTSASPPFTLNGSTSCSSGAPSLKYYQSQFQAIHPGVPSQTLFFATVASQFAKTCLGNSQVVPGTRYMELASAMGGQSYDICSQSIGSTLTSLAASLQGQRVNFHTHYLFINGPADPTSIVVTLYPGGDTTKPQVIQEDATNGWSYAGQVTNVYTINAPINMNQASGYAIELNGSAELVGDDTASVSFKPAGSKNTVSK